MATIVPSPALVIMECVMLQTARVHVYLVTVVTSVTSLVQQGTLEPTVVGDVSVGMEPCVIM